MNNPLRVLIVHERFAPDFGGGGEYIALEVARGLIQRGMEVSVITTGDPAQSEYQGIPVKRLPISRYRFNLAFRSVAAAAREADVIQAFNYHASLPALVAARATGKPVVCEILGLFDRAWLDLRGRLLGHVFRAWERWLVRLPFNRTVFLSDFSLEMGLDAGADPERCVVNAPGIAQHALYRAEQDENKVLFVGKLEARKGIDDVYAVARALPEIEFDVVGWSEDYEADQARAPANVTIHYQRGQALYDTFARARIFFFPSRAETFGLVVAEAMAAGCAIVSSVPLKFSGFTVEPGDRDAMVSAVRQLWSDPELSARMGQENLERARAFDWDRHIDTLCRLYTETLSERAQRARS